MFNVGNYRRKINGAVAMHDFFDDKNEDGMAIRLKSGTFHSLTTPITPTPPTHSNTTTARLAMDDMKHFLQAGKDLGRVAIYDATNTTRKRRSWIVKEVLPLLEKKSQIIFVESICDDDRMVERNIKRVKITMPDYKGVDGDSVLKDFKKRIDHYVDVYVVFITRITLSKITQTHKYDENSNTIARTQVRTLGLQQGQGFELDQDS